MATNFPKDYPATRTWRCDTCGGPVSIEDGYVVWNSHGKDRDFRIIHQSRCDDESLDSSMALSDLVGVEGIASLLSLLTAGPLMSAAEGASLDKDICLSDFADLFRRLHVPNYERARQYFEDQRVRENVIGMNERAMYMPAKLAEIAAIGEAPDNGG